MKELSPYFFRHTRSIGGAEAGEWPPMFFDSKDERLELWHYWRIVRSHHRLILALVLAALLITALDVSMKTPIYTAHTTILIGPHGVGAIEARAANFSGSSAPVRSDYYFFRTQVSILESRSLAAQVVRSEDLAHNRVFTGADEKPGFISGLWGSATAWLRKALFSSGSSVHPEQAQPAGGSDGDASWIVGAYMDCVTITPLEETDLVDISVSTRDPNLSARLANAHARGYIRQGIQIHSQANKEAERFLEKKLIELKERLKQSEIALNDYRRAKGIIPGLMSLNGKDAIVLDRLTDLSKDLTAAQVKRLGLEAQMQLIRKRKYDSLPAVTAAPSVQALQAELNRLYTKEAALANQFTPNYPPLARLRVTEAATRNRLNREIRRVVDGVKASYQEAVAKEKKLKAEMDQQRALTLSLNESAVQYAILQRDVDTNRQLYNSVLQGMKDVGVAAETRTSNVSIIDQAVPPGGPSSPRKTHALLLSGVLSLALGIGLAFFLDYLDNRLTDPEQVESYLRLPSLGMIPLFSSLHESTYGAKRLPAARPVRGSPAPGTELVSAYGAQSMLRDAYRDVRTSILLSRAGAPPRTSMFTSAFASEGKTVTAVNTAIILAQIGGEVLLIDADLRKPRCHQMLGTRNHLGLTEVLTGAREPDEVIRPTPTDHLFLLSSGTIPPNPTELLGSEKMQQILADLRERYAYIVIDTVPVMPVSDALVFCAMVDGVVLVVNSAKTPKHQVRAACARLEYARGKILGVVLNKVDVSSPGYDYYYHDGYYSSGPDSPPEFDNLL